jgi:[acyl-carrier-protein] S-malonyltransferase
MSHKIAALFPGQGAQTIGMAQDFYQHSPAAEQVLEATGAVLPGLLDVMWQGPEDTLTLTTNQQPALLAASAAALAAYREAGGASFEAVAGHSLGEFSAYYAADSVTLNAALKLVRRRAEHMQRAVPAGTGSMAAVLKVSAEEVAAVCQSTPGVVEVANYNSPQQTVISGAVDAVNAASETLKAGKARVIPLAVSAPFHSSLMEPAAEAFYADLEATTFAPLTVPLVSNVDAQPIADTTNSAALLTAQVTSSVRWTDTINRLVAGGVTVFIELGSGAVLTGLVKRIVPKGSPVTAVAVSDMASLQKALETLAA